MDPAAKGDPSSGPEGPGDAVELDAQDAHGDLVEVTLTLGLGSFVASHANTWGKLNKARPNKPRQHPVPNRKGKCLL